MKNILVFTSTFPKFIQGDATPPFVYELSQRLALKWLSIIVLTPRIPGSKKYEVKDNIKIYRYPYFFKSSREKLNDGAILPNIKKNKRLIFQIPFLLIAWFFALVRITKKEHIKIIHAHWLVPQWLLAAIYKKIWNRKIKILCTAHGSDIHSVGGKFMNYIKKFVLNTSNHITVVSKYLQDEVRKLGIKKHIDVISMGVNTTFFSPEKYDSNIKKNNGIMDKFLLYVGRLAPEKWVNFLIDAMPEIVRLYPNIKLMLIGSWPLALELKHQAKILHIEHNLIWKWWVDHNDLPPYFATADIFILPSLKESFGLVLVEALLSWSLVIASKLDWIWDIIQNWKNGFLVEPKDYIGIAEKVVYCLKNITTLQSERDQVRKNISNKFGWDVISEKYFNILISYE